MTAARRGLTLVELLVSISLLSSVLLGAGWWIRAAADVGLRCTRELRFEAAAEALLDALDHDLAVGDFGMPDDRRPGSERIVAKDGVLAVHTREPGVGPVQHRYELRPGAGDLVRSSRASAGAAKSAASESATVVLGDVAEWRCELDLKTNILSVHLRSSAGRVFDRRWCLP